MGFLQLTTHVSNCSISNPDLISVQSAREPLLFMISLQDDNHIYVFKTESLHGLLLSLLEG